MAETDRVVRSVSEAHGLPFFSYIHLAGRAHVDLGVANFPDEWAERYVSKQYIHYDPVLAVGRTARLPYLWDNTAFISPFKKSEQKVFHEAGAYGINAGYSVPISGRAGELGLFNIAGQSEREMAKVMKEAADRFYVLGMQVHDHMLTLGSHKQPTVPGFDLSARELECMKWAAEGLTTDQIADRMAISAATVNYHFNKIVPKFDASNRHHAVIKANRLGLI